MDKSLEKYALQNNYYIALMLACTMGFDNVTELNDSYVFTSSPSSTNYTIENTTTVTSTPIPQNNFNRRLPRRSRPSENSPLNIVNFDNMLLPESFSLSAPIQQSLTNVKSYSKKQLVPFSLTLPKIENATLKDINSAFISFFKKIIALTKSKNKNDFSQYNIANLNRIFEIAKAFINSNKTQNEVTGVLEPYFNALFRGVRYCGINYLGSIRSLNVCNYSAYPENKALPMQIIENTKSLLNNNMLQPFFFSEVYSSTTNETFKKLYNNETPEITAILNNDMPETLSLKQQIINGLNDFADYILAQKNKNNNKI